VGLNYFENKREAHKTFSNSVETLHW